MTWVTLETLNLPETVDFTDYSSIGTLAYPDDPDRYRVAISSQEDSRVWIGQLNIKDWSFSHGKIYDFPRNANCEIVYCNIEGIHWLNEHLLVATSDKMKSKQPHQCFEKDQSVHIFALP